MIRSRSVVVAALPPLPRASFPLRNRFFVVVGLTVYCQVLEGVHLLSSGRLENYGWTSLYGDARRWGVGFLALAPMRYLVQQ